MNFRDLLRNENADRWTDGHLRPRHNPPPQIRRAGVNIHSSAGGALSHTKFKLYQTIFKGIILHSFKLPIASAMPV